MPYSRLNCLFNYLMILLDLEEDIESNTQNAFLSYLLDNSIAIQDITNYNNRNKDIQTHYHNLIYSAVQIGLDGFKDFEKNGLEIAIIKMARNLWNLCL